MSFTYDMPGFKALSYNVFKVGKRIKASKVRHSWRFELEGEEHAVDLYVSRLTRRRKLIVDGLIKLEEKGSAIDKNYPVRLGTFSLGVHEIASGKFDIRFNNRSFQSYLSGRKSEGFSHDDPFRRRDPFEDSSFDRNPFPDRTPEKKIEKRVFSTGRVSRHSKPILKDSSSESEEEAKAPQPRAQIDIFSLEPEYRPVIKNLSKQEPTMKMPPYNQFMTGAYPWPNLHKSTFR